MRFLFWGFRRWLAAKIRPKEASVLTEFCGGPKDGEKEVVAGDVYPVTAALPIVLSPWASDDRDATDLCRVVRLGTYYREGPLMKWRREWVG